MEYPKVIFTLKENNLDIKILINKLVDLKINMENLELEIIFSLKQINYLLVKIISILILQESFLLKKINLPILFLI
jgi:hypothetical protein